MRKRLWRRHDARKSELTNASQRRKVLRMENMTKAKIWFKCQLSGKREGNIGLRWTKHASYDKIRFERTVNMIRNVKKCVALWATLCVILVAIGSTKAKSIGKNKLIWHASPQLAFFFFGTPLFNFDTTRVWSYSVLCRGGSRSKQHLSHPRSSLFFPSLFITEGCYFFACGGGERPPNCTNNVFTWPTNPLSSARYIDITLHCTFPGGGI